MNNEVQIKVDNDIIRLFAQPQNLFAVINGLILQNKNPTFRTFDQELNDWTCWQTIDNSQ